MRGSDNDQRIIPLPPFLCQLSQGRLKATRAFCSRFTADKTGAREWRQRNGRKSVSGDPFTRPIIVAVNVTVPRHFLHRADVCPSGQEAGRMV